MLRKDGDKYSAFLLGMHYLIFAPVEYNTQGSSNSHVTIHLPDTRGY